MQIEEANSGRFGIRLQGEGARLFAPTIHFVRGELFGLVNCSRRKAETREQDQVPRARTQERTPNKKESDCEKDTFVDSFLVFCLAGF